MTTPTESPTRIAPPASEATQWQLFCVAIVLLKFILLALDPLPKLFIGDSISYIATALEGWIPDDRSYFYGYLINWVSLSTGSLLSLLLLQTFISALTALLLAHIGRSMLGLSARASFILGLICALDPFQLVWERYVMTETISLFFYVAGLYYTFLYLRHRAIRHLAIVQGIWVLLIGFRMSYLLVVQVSAVLLPILAFAPFFLESWRNRGIARSGPGFPVKVTLIHLTGSIAMLFLFHGAYKQVNGLITGREPAYLYATGLHLLAFWAPILVPADASDERLAQIIAKGEEFDIKELTERNNQRFKAGYLVPQWQEIEPDVSRANQVAKVTALRALRRDPLGVLKLAARTLAQYRDFKGIQYYAKIDLGHHDLTPEHCAMLAGEFHFATDGRIIDAPPTLLQRFFLVSWPYCYLLMLSPFFGALAVCFARDKRLALLLLLHLTILLAVTFTFTVAPSLRYLQPVSVLALLTIALGLRSFLDSRLPEGLASSRS